MTGLLVEPGPRLLAAYDEGPGLEPHRVRFGDLPRLALADLVELAERPVLSGRGGAGFPFGTKLAAVARRRHPVVVVNLSEGEPASAKDAVLGLGRPHLVLDGAELAARALHAREVHVILPGQHLEVGDAIRTAIAERSTRSGRSGRGRLTWCVHEAEERFVAGQARAVLELMSGRPNLPVTSWTPEVFDGHRGRPTLLSNAETWAQLAARALPGSREVPETTLLTWDGERSPLVREVTLGTPWGRVLPQGYDAFLLGGYHGSWVRRAHLETLQVDHRAMAAAGVPLGAGALIPAVEECPVTMTARITAYLAGQSAQRCGPCFNGLPALAAAVAAVAEGRCGTEESERLLRLVAGRGACAHPDGTARLVRSLLDTFPDEVARHRSGACRSRGVVRSAS